jgi:hypothetical protein
MFGISALSQVPFSTIPLSAGTSFVESLIENLSVADNNTQVWSFTQSITENVVMNDIDATAGDFFGLINEFVGINDVNNIAAQFVSSIAEPFNVDNVQEISAGFAQSVTENVNLNDVLVPYFAALQSRNENADLDDADTTQADFLYSLNENSFINSVEIVVPNFNVSRIEPILNVDNQQSIIAGFAQSVAENIDILDLNFVESDFLFALTEPSTVEDPLIINAQFPVVRLENSRVNDTSTDQFGYLEFIVEDIRVLDVICYNGWFKIENNQTVTWNSIANTQTPNWSNINDDQTQNWDRIDTTQSCS